MKHDNLWINPLGGLGDALMLSGALKLAYDCNPDRKYNLIRRTKYLSILEGHPALDAVGFPPKNAEIIDTGYWSRKEYGTERAFQILASIFGLSVPVEEKLYMPGVPEDVPLFADIPFGKNNVIIAPASDSPRKEMAIGYWVDLVKMLRRDGCFVLQVGKMNNKHIRGAYSLLGLTTPRQLAALVKRCDMVVTPDNFIMHLAHLTGTPAVVLWGPTIAETYGYRGHVHLRAVKECAQRAGCIGPKNNAYARLCERGPGEHCMNRIGSELIYERIKEKI
ncbi:MAG: glycosyltransferase family 9 protein [Nitrospirae bacterium]|nr:glycosyltransferase family 9 protein [Nitrospirota bacterium]